MDAQAYLIKHGWSGPGNPLNPNKRPGAHSGLGLTRPLLVSRKANNHGVGKKTTKDPTNQWWLRGFEDALKGVGNDSFEANSARENNALTRGDGLAGTLEGMDKNKKDESGTSTSTSKSKRKRENEDDGDRKARKLAKAARKVEKAERKEVRRVKRAAKVERKEKKTAGKLAKKALKEKKGTASEEDYPTPTSIDQESDQTGAETTETDEAVARLAEKAAKKEMKESKKAKSTGGDVGAEDKDSKKKSKKEKKDKKETKA
ncbi:Protein TMA23 [Penicillium samsonianum]|uniref:Protein TMA23 n=1 Tax=Penicillium samsonianum TaxID=1882272 RepID=UPI0025469959|nr:Protein TMA23 [Penicillium samsonianum]KAJ6137378.1 Protein TMA23 [Penicillium samsonianum]